MNRVIGPDFDFDTVAYRPIRLRWTDPGPTLCYANLEVRRAQTGDADRVFDWLVGGGLLEVFGIATRITLEDIRRRELPDGSGGVEPVDFLIVEEPPIGPIGLSVCYEASGDGDPEQEIDFGLLQPKSRSGLATLRKIKIAVLSYLFAVCGARRVTWLRRKPVALQVRGPGPPASATVFRTGTEAAFEVDDLIRMLRRAGRRVAGEEEMHVVNPT